MHGIRDDGTWTHRISAAIKREWESGLPVGELYPTWTHSYGYFPMLPFILPWIRKSKVEWFMDNYVSVKAAYPNATLHYVGHSNGTYLAASALQDYPAARFGNVYFAGSVVHPRYDWATAHERGQIEKLHNARGGEDWVVALLPKSIEYFSDLGGAGFDGFDDLYGFTQSEKFARGGHSGAITEGHWGEIAKFIVKGEKPFAVGEPDWLFAPRQHRFFRILGALRVGVPLGFAIAALLIVLAVLLCQFDHWRIGGFAVTALGVAWLTVAGKVIGGVASAPAVEPKAPETPKPFPTWLLWVLAAGLLILSLLAPGVVAEAGGWAWGGALVAFMVAQYCVERDWRALAARLRAGDRGAALDEWRQRAPQDRTAHALTAAFFVLTAAFLVWALYALLFALGVGSGWAVARFFVIVLLLWFVLTRV
jgi:hypothetical protein